MVIPQPARPLGGKPGVLSQSSWEAKWISWEDPEESADLVTAVSMTLPFKVDFGIQIQRMEANPRRHVQEIQIQSRERKV